MQNIAIQGDKIIPVLDHKPEGAGLWLQATYNIQNSQRGGATEIHKIGLDKNDLLEFVFDDNTIWLCGSDTLNILFPEAVPAANRSGEDNSFQIPSSIKASGANRGIAGDIVIRLIHHFVKTDLDTRVAEIATRIEDKKLENKTGLYLLDSNFQMQPFKPADANKPYLLFLHGTASSTTGSFDKLKGTPEWAEICQTYGGNIIAFQHRSLTESPLQNISQLVAQLPDIATLHLVSHSRGGLLGEILCRFSITDDHNKGFSAAEITLLKKEGRDGDIENINKIQAALATKKISVAKFVRVACPAAGTTLASSRTDYFFNIIGNLTGSDSFRELIAAVVNTKNDVNVLPGLEAMDPESPFIKVLNDATFDGFIESPLSVISGNCGLKPGLKALLIIAVKLFFRRDNDLVVNTGSMYQGSKRTTNLQYFFDKADDVDHFSYFGNQATVTALSNALKQIGNAPVPGFSTMTREEALAARSLIESGALFMDHVTGKRPIVILMPGIMGSNLSIGDDRIWINYLNFITGGLMQLESGPITATSIVATSYRKLANFLNDTYDVVTFPFDWRLQLNECATSFNSKVEELLKFNQPIKIIAHSMGGVVVRDFIVTNPERWKQLRDSTGFQLLFLGAPLGGSFRIPNVLFGRDPIIVKLSLIDIIHTKKELLKVFSQLPGILSLLPLSTDGDNDMGSDAIWAKMKAAFGDDDWPVPSDKPLEDFRAYRDAVNKTVIDYKGAVYIAGRDKATPYSYQIDETGLTFLSTSEGDSSVTWDSGIPQQLIKADQVYYTGVTHGQLANDNSLFGGIADILSDGRTSLLSKQRPVMRGETEKVFRTPDMHNFDLSAAGVENTILGTDTETPEEEGNEIPVKASVSQGDLLYAAYPLLNGHFKGDGILYAEKAIDSYLKGALTRRHKLGLYPGTIGSSEVLLTPYLKLKGALVVGLGEAGTLTAYQLSLTVEQGIANYLLFLESNNEVPAVIGISSLIIGCGYGGLTIENSIRAILQGVQRANAKVRKLQGRNARVVSHVEFIEKYEDRALNGCYALHTLQRENSRSFAIDIDNDIKTLLGRERRVLKDQAEGWWTRITVQLINKEGESDKIKRLQFSASTGGAREEQKQLSSSLDIISSLIKEISTGNEWSREAAKTLFELLIPNDFKEQFKKQANICWILDENTAAYPWELLHDGLVDNEPLAVNAGMIRQLATNKYRLTINAVTKRTALIIADPQTKGYLPSLPAAFKEGKRVAEILREEGFDNKEMIQQSSFSIIKALFADDYKIIHMAGHGVYNKESPEASGMVIGNKIFLSTREIGQMSTVPELVFVNCCSLGEVDGVEEQFYSERYQLAANIGVQLIQNGVKAVIAAGWAVNDDAAFDFTDQFYTAMFSGCTFGYAIQTARKYIYEHYDKSENNTWGAYQCYGDPFYKLTDILYRGPEETISFVMPQEAEDALFNLLNKVEMGEQPVEEYLKKLTAISAAVDKAGLRNTAITENEAMIYAELGEYDLAVAKFEQLLKAENAAFSLLAAENYCNISCKKCISDILLFPRDRTKLIERFNNVVAYLSSLTKLSETAERYMLLGHAFKYKAMFATTNEQRKKALQQAGEYYQQATGINHTVSNEVCALETDILLALMNGTTAGIDVEDKLNIFLQQDRTPLEIFNIKLVVLLIQPSTDMQGAFNTLYYTAGSPGKRCVVKEHLQFLSMALSWCNQAEGKDSIDKLIKDWV